MTFLLPINDKDRQAVHEGFRFLVIEMPSRGPYIRVAYTSTLGEALDVANGRRGYTVLPIDEMVNDPWGWWKVSSLWREPLPGSVDHRLLTKYLTLKRKPRPGYFKRGNDIVAITDVLPRVGAPQPPGPGDWYVHGVRTLTAPDKAGPSPGTLAASVGMPLHEFFDWTSAGWRRIKDWSQLSGAWQDFFARNGAAPKRNPSWAVTAALAGGAYLYGRSPKIRKATGTAAKSAYGKAKEMLDTKRNPAAAGVDEHAVRELVLFIENDSHLWTRRLPEYAKNLAAKMKRGTYDAGKAVKLIEYLTQEGATKYRKDFGGSASMFSPATRRQAAIELLPSVVETAEEMLDTKRNPSWAVTAALAGGAYLYGRSPKIRKATGTAAKSAYGKASSLLDKAHKKLENPGKISSVEVIDTLNDRYVHRVRADGKGMTKFNDFVARYGKRGGRYVVQAIDVSGRVIADNQGVGGRVRH